MDEVQIWKTKKILKNLKNARGNGTSMISLIIPPKECISRSTRLLTDEYGTASNIKSRVNKNSVLSAIVSAQAKLKTYSKTPTNGLAIYVGTVVEDTKEKKVSIGIEPIKPINTSLYMCDSKFHVDDLLRQYEDESKFGIIVMDGHSTLFSTVQGNVKTILQELTVDLPKKHGRGGQSSVRFARLRLEKRLNYIKKVAEIMNGIYLTDSKINVEGLILAG
ncbi:subunit 1 of eukaryotic peptide chain release factor, partial [Hamiltosporidium tvaerminnensis]